MPPTDERYLNATPEIIIEDYWAHELTERRQRALQNGGKAETLDQALSDGQSFQEQLDKFIDSMPEYEAISAAPKFDDTERIIEVKAPVHISRKAKHKG